MPCLARSESDSVASGTSWSLADPVHPPCRRIRPRLVVRLQEVWSDRCAFQGRARIVSRVEGHSCNWSKACQNKLVGRPLPMRQCAKSVSDALSSIMCPIRLGSGGLATWELDRRGETGRDAGCRQPGRRQTFATHCWTAWRGPSYPRRRPRQARSATMATPPITEERCSPLRTTTREAKVRRANMACPDSRLTEERPGRLLDLSSRLLQIKPPCSERNQSTPFQSLQESAVLPPWTRRW